MAGAADAEESQPSDPRELAFVRVHVPGGRLADVPLGTGRYVPMSAREFAEGVARLTADAAAGADLAAPPVANLATSARLIVEVQADGKASGTAEFDIGWPVDDGVKADLSVVRGREMPLAGFDVRSGVMRTAAGTGAAVVFGRRDGGVAMATPADGTYGFRFAVRLPPETDRQRLVLPLVPALASSIVLVVPRGLRPVTTGGSTGDAVWEPLEAQAAADAAESAEPRGRWRLAVGPRPGIECLLVPEGAAPTAVSVWSDIAILGRQAWFTANSVPAAAWREGAFELEKDPEVVVTAVKCAAAGVGPISWRVAADGRRLVIDLPPELVGRRAPVTLHGAAPIPDGGGRVPMVRPPEGLWRSGGTLLRMPADMSAVAVECEQCVAVSPADAAAWPLAPGEPGESAMAGDSRPPEDADAPRFWLEHQSPRAAVRLAMRPAEPVFDVARVTTVDLSPAAVTARATCDVRVDRGIAFDLTARVAPQWIIDSVELVEGLTVADPEKPSRRLTSAAPGVGIDWRFDAGVLRIGLPSAAAAGRRFFLRVTGRHPGIPLESDFSTAAIDMVQFDGEADRGALLELRTNPETAIEFDGADTPAPGPEGRLAVLAEDGPVRARSWAGHRVAARNGRLVRRRPPLDVRTQVRLTLRDERLTEAFTFDCRPAGSDLDSLVVQFSSASEDPIVWSLLPPAVGTVSARRMDPPDRRPGAGTSSSSGGDRWLVEITPAARGPVTIRGARTSALVRPGPLPLAWVDGATSTAGEVFVKDAGRSRLNVVNHRLAELPRLRQDTDFVAEFAFDAVMATDGVDGPAAELVPWAGEPRACAWREVVTSWCHSSGRTEHETCFEIDNHGRTTVLVEVQRGQRLQGVLIDDVRVPLGDGIAATGSVAVELPLGKRLVKLLVRTAVERPARPQRGVQLAWQVTAAPVRLADIPVLEREWVLLLPPGLEILRRGRGVRVVGGDVEADDVLGRLFAAAVRPATAGLGAGATAAFESAAEPPREGFRRVMLAQDGQEAAGVTVAPSAAVAVTKTVAALLAAALLIVLPRRGRAAAVVVLAGLGVGALWAEPPFTGILRVAFWIGLATFLVATRAASRDERRGGWLVAAVVGLASVPGAARAAPPAVEPADVPGPLKVFMMPPAPGGDAATATVLVPERLFRLLAQGEQGGAATAGVRVLAARATWTVPADGRPVCRLLVETDADEGGVLQLEQADETARFLAGSWLVDGTAAACRLRDGDRGLWTPPLAAGRHAIEVEIAPAVEQHGDVEVATVTIPAAPRAAVALRASALPTGSVACEMAGPDGVFTAMPAAPATGDEATFDAATATRVRLVRSRSGARLADGPRAVASRNDIRWEPDACRLVASFAIEPGDAILRQFVVASDKGLEWLPAEPAAVADRQHAAAAGVVIRPLTANRHLVEVVAPRAGAVRFGMSFRMPLSSPTGIFDLPGVWLEQAAADSRSVRLSIDPALAARAEPPPGWVTAAPGAGDAVPGGWSWQREFQRSGQPDTGRIRLVTERRPQAARGTQQQSLIFSGEQLLLRLDARIEAPAALVTLPIDVPAGCVIDRVTLTQESPPRTDGGERAVIDTRLSRPAPTLAEIVCQRPRSGTFRLEVDARLPGRQPPRGELPLLRARLAEPSATRIDWQLDWNTAESLELVVTEGDRVLAAGVSGSFDHAADAGAIEYRLRPAEAVTAAPPAATVTTDAAETAGGERVELADIRLAIDPRGGMWGIAAFELVAARNPLVLRMPRNWRLFDVSIDGKPVAGLTPAPPPADESDRHADAFWEVRLLDTGWPRTIVALFKGELGSGAVAGEPLALVPPTIVGLSTRGVLWTLDLPGGMRPLVTGPAHHVPRDILSGERRAARQRLDEEFSAALDRAGGGDRTRIAEFFAARREGTMPVADSAWTRNRAAASPSGSTNFMVAAAGPAAGDEEIPTLRLVRAWDAQGVGRLVCTLLLVAAAVFEGTRRGGLAAALRGPWVALVGLLLGAAWAVFLDPVWPGAVVALLAAVRLAVARARAMPNHMPRERGEVVTVLSDGPDMAIEGVTELHRR